MSNKITCLGSPFHDEYPEEKIPWIAGEYESVGKYLKDRNDGNLPAEYSSKPRNLVYSGSEKRFYLIPSQKEQKDCKVHGGPTEVCSFIGWDNIRARADELGRKRCGGELYSREQLLATHQKIQAEQLAEQLESKDPTMCALNVLNDIFSSDTWEFRLESRPLAPVTGLYGLSPYNYIVSSSSTKTVSPESLRQGLLSKGMSQANVDLVLANLKFVRYGKRSGSSYYISDPATISLLAQLWPSCKQASTYDDEYDNNYDDNTYDDEEYEDY